MSDKICELPLEEAKLELKVMDMQRNMFIESTAHFRRSILIPDLPVENEPHF